MLTDKCESLEKTFKYSVIYILVSDCFDQEIYLTHIFCHHKQLLMQGAERQGLMMWQRCISCLHDSED